MMLSVQTYKIRKEDYCPIYDTKRYPSFDVKENGNTFEEQFNKAFNVLKEEIYQDKLNNEMDKYTEIVISNVFVS